jgi:uncharacterized membrane protein
MKKAGRAFFGALLTFCIANEAAAQLRFCNRTSKKVQFAYMTKEGDAWRTHGWFSYAPNECAPVTQESALRRFYYYAKRDDGIRWSGKDTDPTGCIEENSFDLDADSCSGEGQSVVNFRPVKVVQSGPATVAVTKSDETVDFRVSENKDKACEVLNATLEKPQMRTEKVVIANYTDVFTPPQTKTECNHVIDTGVPDPSTCSTSWDECATHQDLPFGGWTCLPGSTTRCSGNVKTCDGWTTYKKQMQCDLTFQLKLPNFIEAPISELVDNSFRVIESARSQVAGSLPLQCAPAASDGHGGEDVTSALARQIADELREKVINAIRREAIAWAQETAIETVAASIPSGGVGGGAVLSTQLGSFIYRTQKALKPIIKVANDAKDFAEDVGFDTSCGWDPDWHPL